jgi:hypothetical protein
MAFSIDTGPPSLIKRAAPEKPMKHSTATWFTNMAACTLLAACGGGGGGDTANPSPTTTSSVKSLASITTPTSFDFNNFAVVNVTWNQVTTTALTTAATSAGVTDNKIQIQIWYLDASSARETVASTTLAAFKTSYPSGMTLRNIPKSVSKLQAESYFWDAAQSKTITSGILEISL